VLPRLWQWSSSNSPHRFKASRLKQQQTCHHCGPDAAK
jgi:hypothetical protein